MDKKIKDLFTNAEFNPPAEEWRIREIEEDLGFKLPYDYKEFLREFDGVKGKIGNNDIDLWSANFVLKSNLDNSTQFDNVVYFGSDNENDTIYAFWYKHGIEVIKIPMKSRKLAKSEIIAKSFPEFLENLSKEDKKHQYEFQEKRISGGSNHQRIKEIINIDLDNTNIYLNRQEHRSDYSWTPIGKKWEENTVIPIEKISSIQIKCRYGIFHLIRVMIVVFLVSVMNSNNRNYMYYRYKMINNNYLLYTILIISGSFVLVHLIVDGFILNLSPDKKIRIKKSDGTSIYIPIIARQKSQTKKDIKKILESVKEINPDIEIKDTSILEMIIIIVICLSMIGISIMNLYGSFKA